MVKRLVIFVLLSVLTLPAATILSICPMLAGRMPVTPADGDHDCCKRHAGKTPECHPKPCAQQCALNRAPDSVSPAYEAAKAIAGTEFVLSNQATPVLPEGWVADRTYIPDRSGTHLKNCLLRI